MKGLILVKEDRAGEKFGILGLKKLMMKTSNYSQIDSVGTATKGTTP